MDRIKRLEAVIASLRKEREAESVPVSGVVAVDPDEVLRQRDLNWPDFHPERFCHRCGRRNINWYVESSFWNDAVAGPGRGVVSILCPVCFVEQHEAATGLHIIWEVRADPKSGDLRRLSESLAETPKEGRET